MKTFYSRVSFVNPIPCIRLTPQRTVNAGPATGLTVYRLTEDGRDDVLIERGGVVLVEIPWSACLCGVRIVEEKAPRKVAKPKDEAA